MTSPDGMPQVDYEVLLRENESLRRRVVELERERSSASQEKRVRWRRALLHLLVDVADEYAAFGLDVEGRVVAWNRGAERLFGYRDDEILGESVVRFYTPADVAAGRPQQDLERARTERTTELEGWRLRKDGSQFIANSVTATLRGEQGTVEGFSRVVRDISERRWAERALRESERRFRLFMNYSPAVYFIKDGDGRLLYVDESWERTFRSAVGEWTGRTDAETWPDEIAESIRQNDLAALESQKTLETQEILPTFRGEVTWQFFRFPFLDPAGRRVLGGIGIDVTEQERARDDIQRLNADLERRVAERTGELTVAVEELDAFCYSVSHDLRAPLRGIDGFSQALLEDYSDRLNAEGRDYLQRVRAEAQRMGQLIDDLLELSRVSRLDLRRERVDLTRMAREIVETLRRRDPRRNIAFHVAEGLTAEADERLIRIALENLLGNAWKFTGTRDEARAEFGKIEAPDGRTTWFVRDNGVGFNMTYADYLFGAFQRLHSGTEFPGTGIGLATVQRIIHRHGGRVWADAVPDSGATFYFTLETTPVASEAQDPQR